MLSSSEVASEAEGDCRRRVGGGEASGSACYLVLARSVAARQGGDYSSAFAIDGRHDDSVLGAQLQKIWLGYRPRGRVLRTPRATRSGSISVIKISNAPIIIRFVTVTTPHVSEYHLCHHYHI